LSYPLPSRLVQVKKRTRSPHESGYDPDSDIPQDRLSRQALSGAVDSIRAEVDTL